MSRSYFLFTDYDPVNQIFIVRRSISARKDVESTNQMHYIPCHPAFVRTTKTIISSNNESPYFFVNSRARKDGKRYTNESLNNIWKKACQTAGENIDLYIFNFIN